MCKSIGLYAESRNVCYVNSNGILNWNDCDYTNGVRPFWWSCEVYKPCQRLQGECHIKRVYNPSHAKVWDKYKRLLWTIFKFLRILGTSIILSVFQ